jgi:hypothetical protein
MTEQIQSREKIELQATMAARLHHAGQPMRCHHPEGTEARLLWTATFDNRLAFLQMEEVSV